MITTINEYRLLLESINKSTNSKELLKILIKTFGQWSFENYPLGEFSEVIEAFNFKYDKNKTEIDKILKVNNWFINKLNPFTINPIYSNVYTTSIPKYLYHYSNTENDESIKNNGIIASTGKKRRLNYPPRIYVTNTTNVPDYFTKELFTYYGKDYSIWKIETSKLNIDKLYLDQTVNQSSNNPYAFYIQDININKEYIIYNEK